MLDVHMRTCISYYFIDVNINNSLCLCIIMSKCNTCCCVHGCKSVRKKNQELMFHSFPKQHEDIEVKDEFGEIKMYNRKLLWENELKMAKKATRAMTVCSLHFRSEDYTCSGWSSQKRLKGTAVPSLNLPKANTKVEVSTLSELDHFDNQIKKTENDCLFNCQLDNLIPYQCKKCWFKADLKIILLDQHMNDAHGPIKQEHSSSEYTLKTFICRTCSFETYSQLVYIGHECKMKKMEPKSKTAKWFECGHCPYKSKTIYTLRHHVVVKHTSPEDIHWFECKQCPYKTKVKRYLGAHIKVKHISPEDTKWFECEQCPYKSKKKHLLRLHTISKHRTSKEVDKLFKCNQCSFQSNWKYNLKNHIMTKHSEDVSWFKCDQCMFQTKRKTIFKQHISVKHFVQNDIMWYECESCPFKTKRRQYLKNHVVVIHTDPEDIEWLKCELCSYRAKTKQALRRHVLENCVNPDRKLYECEHCSHKTENKYKLKEHVVLKHTSPEDIQWFECKQCPFRTKRKKNLAIHMRHKHVNLEIAKWLECEQCSYRTKVKDYLRTHMRCQHNSLKETKMVRMSV